MNEFVIATDFFDTSDSNVYTGYHFAKALMMKPTLFYVDEISPQIERTFHDLSVNTEYVEDAEWESEFPKTDIELAEQQLQRLELNKNEFEFMVFEGTVNDGIDYLKKERDLRIVSIGLTEHGKIHRLFFNTFAEKTFCHVSKATLIVKKRSNKFENLIYLMDPRREQEKEIAQVAELAKLLNAQVELVSVAPIQFLGVDLEGFPNEPEPEEIKRRSISYQQDKAEAYLDSVKKDLEDSGIPAHYDFETTLNSTPEKKLESIVEKSKADLVLMNPLCQLFDHFAIGSIASKVLKDLNSNYLLLPSGVKM